MLGIECFDNFEHYCFEKYDISGLFQSICDVINDIIQISVQIVKSGKLRYNCLFDFPIFFSFLVFVCLIYILDHFY